VEPEPTTSIEKARMTSTERHSRSGSLPGLPFSFLGVALLVALLGPAGCPSPDAEGKYDRFNEQTEDDREVPEPKMDFGMPVLPDLGGTGSGGETETDGGGGLQVDGVYLVAVDTIVSPGLPLQFLGEVTAELDAMGNGTISVEFQPLSLDPQSTTDPREEVGEALVIDGDVSGYSFTLPFGETMVTGAANPITGSDIVANLELQATIRSEDAWCGTVTGMVLSPIMVDLAGSNFAAIRLADRSERPLKFPCQCGTVDGEPGPDNGCFPTM
jgi:hypothetical protein